MNLSEAGLELFRKHLDVSGTFEMSGKGTSMFPLIIEGERCVFKSVSGQVFTPGSIYLYADDQGRFVVHRLIYEKQSGLYLKGDANLGMDPVIKADQVIGELMKVKKQSKWVGPNDGMWKVHAHLLQRHWYRKCIVRLSKKKR
ncbi:hypothetical protein JMA_33670 [Jeotgalibacillus malaysiensis]|uniref:Peptidase S24/S26A/S26B/S26C domain-containing protein n=1 Tax=Jeotgalibacillus malaysiensis TaxID=1508404 RepID=A0A0B5AXD5_9BACL|nr:S24/S26 family peptidase [Jeotgalibacillus malaysiensis]AJD92684.1 hypothetical protein JMA_33670 [Jeotgalibacillus malaysiensis]